MVPIGSYWVTRPNLNHGCNHAGSGTATIAVGYLVECNPSAAAGLLAPAYLHVVRHRRGRPDGAGGIARRHQHRTRLEPAHQAARSLSQLDRLSALWARAVLGLFPSPVRINGRLVLVGDGI